MTEPSEKPLRIPPVSSLPQPARDTFLHLRNEVLALSLIWGTYNELYAGSPERIELLNKHAPGAFAVVQSALLDDLTLRIIPLLDPPATHGSKNLTLSQLIQQIQNSPKDKIPKKEKLVSNLKERFDDLERVTSVLQDWRNKLQVHRDYDILTGKKAALTARTYEEVEESIHKIIGFMDCVTEHLGDPKTGYVLASIEHGGNALVVALKKASVYDELEKAGVAEYRQWTQGK